MKLSTHELEALNTRFETTSPHELIQWAASNHLSGLAMMTSFQISGMVILDILAELQLKLPLYFIDTGYHFSETLALIQEVENRYGIQPTILRPALNKSQFELKYGDDLYKRNPNQCCAINKTQVQEQATDRADWWISGLRRDQGPSRAQHRALMLDRNGKLRIHPLINWSREQVWEYIRNRNVPYNTLYDQGYSSIGCSPESCTQPTFGADNERAGRWAGSQKTECGLHLSLSADAENTVYQNISKLNIK